MKKSGTHQPGVKIRLAGMESYPNEGNNLARHHCQESESLERKNYTLSKDAGASPDFDILLPQPINKSKRVSEQAPSKKKTITVDEYQVRGERKCHDQLDQACLDSQCQKKEKEATRKLAELKRVDEEDRERLAKMKELQEREEKAKQEAAKVAWEKTGTGGGIQDGGISSTG